MHNCQRAVQGAPGEQPRGPSGAARFSAAGAWARGPALGHARPGAAPRPGGGWAGGRRDVLLFIFVTRDTSHLDKLLSKAAA